MKKILSTIMVALILLSTATVTFNAKSDYKYNDTYDVCYRITKDNKIAIVEYYGEKETYKLPPKIKGIDVKKIDDGAFDNVNSKLKNLTIPDTVTTIGSCVFGKRLNKLSIGSGLKNIESNAFCHTDNLCKIKLSSKNKHFVLKDKVLYNKSNTKVILCEKNIKKSTLSIPDKVKTIGDYSFSDCRNIKYIKFGKNTKTIGKGAFQDSKKLSKISISKNITRIGECAFYDCSQLKDIKITANKNLTFGSYVFGSCEKLKKVTVNTNMGKGSFAYCDNLKSIKILSNVTKIPDYFLYECKSLKSVTIPDTVKKIGKYSIGYQEDLYLNSEKIESFVIKGVKGTAAQKYAKANGFKFVALKK